MGHKKPTRARRWVQPKRIAEWLAVIITILTALKLAVELYQLSLILD